MKFRPLTAAVVAFATAAFSLTVSAPADAAATDPVTGLAVSQDQVDKNWVITGDWTPNDTATTYKMLVTDDEAATSVVASRDVTANTASITTQSLVDGGQYWVAVRAKDGDTLGTISSTPFTAIALDKTAPTGTYALNRTSGFLLLDFTASFDESEAADFKVTQTSLSDNTTAAGSITRAIEAGDGSAARAWSTSTATLTYHDPGTFTPKAKLTDEFGNSTTINLPTITVRRDRVNPRVRISTPANPTKVASWRRIKGTATDVGTGIEIALAFVVQKRGRTWYTYDFGKRKWLKGYAGLTKTINKSRARAAQMNVTAAGVWRTPYIRGLRKGPLHVEAASFDRAFNIGEAPKVNRVLH